MKGDYLRSSVVAITILATILMVLATHAAYAETDITDMIQVNKGRMLFDRSTNENYLDVSLTNISEDTLLMPIKLVIESISSPDVTVVNADTYTDEGMPYFIYISSSPDNRLLPGQSSCAVRFRFLNPTRARFSFTYSINGSEYADSLSPPTDLTKYDYDLGGEFTLPIITQKYTGIVNLPTGINIELSSLLIESGIAGETAVSQEGLFIAEMNMDATTLLTVKDSQRDYFFKLFPKSTNIREENPTIDAKSTAVSLIALQAGLITSEPEIDALILSIINNLDEAEYLAYQIETEILSGSFDLKGKLSPEMVQILFAAMESLNSMSVPDVLTYSPIKRIKHIVAENLKYLGPTSAWAWPVDNECFDINNAELYDINDLDEDGVCLTGTINGIGEQSILAMENKIDRWALLALSSNENDLDWIDWVPPKQWTVPNVNDLITNLLSLTWAGSKEFFYKIFTGEDQNFMEEEFQSILESYFGNSTSQKNYIFSEEINNLSVLGSHNSMISEPYSVETGTSFVLGTLTEIFLPWASIAAEIKAKELTKSVGDSIADPACKTRMIAFVIKIWPKVVGTINTYASDGLGSTIKKLGYALDSTIHYM